MRRTSLAVLSAIMFSFVCSSVFGQNAPSLADLARQQRQQKLMTARNTGVTKPRATRVITNADLPESTDSTPSLSAQPASPSSSAGPSAGNQGASAEVWKSQIIAQRSAVASMQSRMSQLNDSIHFAGGNCVANCVQWNERQKQKMDEVARMKMQLDDETKKLETMQESARRQGFGSSVYEP